MMQDNRPVNSALAAEVEQLTRYSKLLKDARFLEILASAADTELYVTHKGILEEIKENIINIKDLDNYLVLAGDKSLYGRMFFKVNVKKPADHLPKGPAPYEERVRWVKVMTHELVHQVTAYDDGRAEAIAEVRAKMYTLSVRLDTLYRDITAFLSLQHQEARRVERNVLIDQANTLLDSRYNMMIFEAQKLLQLIGSMPQPDSQDVEDDLGGYILRLMAHSPQRKLVKEMEDLELLRQEVEAVVATLATSPESTSPSVASSERVG